jgi:hypothetical protein
MPLERYLNAGSIKHLGFWNKAKGKGVGNSTLNSPDNSTRTFKWSRNEDSDASNGNDEDENGFPGPSTIRISNDASDEENHLPDITDIINSTGNILQETQDSQNSTGSQDIQELKPHRLFSWIWNHSTLIDNQFWQCGLCEVPKRYKITSTTHASEHLARFHNILHDQ